MSKVLFDKHPIVISPAIAKEFGLNKAVFLQQLHYWLEQKKARPEAYKDHFVGGHWWVYNTVASWLEEMPYIGSEKTFRRMVTELKNQGVLVVENHNRWAQDHTLWYRIDYSILEQILTRQSGQNDQPEWSKCPARMVKMSRAIPETSSETSSETSDNNTPIAPRGAQTQFDIFWDSYPKKIGKQAALKAWKRLTAEQRKQAIADMQQRPTADQQWLRNNGEYIPNPATYLNQCRFDDVWQTQPLAPVETVNNLTWGQRQHAEKLRQFDELVAKRQAERAKQSQEVTVSVAAN